MSLKKSQVVLSLFAVLVCIFTTLAHAAQINVAKSNKILLFNNEGGLVSRFSLPYSPSIQTVSSDLKVLYSADLTREKLLIHDATTGAVVRQLSLDGKAVAFAEDANRGRLYVLRSNPDGIRVLDTRSHAWIDAYALPATPVSFALNARTDTLYVGYKKPMISIVSASTGRELSTITDVDASVKQIALDENTDRLVALHEKHVSLYRLSDGRFHNYLPLEGEPASIRIHEASGSLYLQLRDEPKTIAVYSLSNLELVGWKNLLYRNYQGREVDVASFFVNSRTGALSFIDVETSAAITFDETNFAGPMAPLAVPAGYTPSADIGVNNTDAGTQLVPACEFDSDGNLLFAWMDDNGNDGSGEGSYARRFTPLIAPMENNFSVPNQPSGDQGSPIIAGGSDRVVVVWRDGLGKDGDSFGVYGRVFNGDVAPPSALTNDVLIPQTTSGRQMMPWVDMRSNGEFVVAWSGRWNAAGGARQTLTRRFDGNGNALGNEVLANTIVKGSTWAVQVDVSPNGRFATVWRDDGDNGIRGRAYDASGNPVAGSSFKVGPITNTTSTFAPSIAIKDDGSFIVVYKENPAGGIVGEKFDANQNSLGTFVVTSKKTKANDAPVIGMAPDGRYVVVWRDSGYPNMETVARAFNADGSPMGDDFVVPEDPNGDEFEPHIAMDAVGNFVAVWKDRNRTPSIYGRYFSAGAPPTPVTVTGITADSGNRGSTADYTVQGTGFDADPTVTVDFNDPGVVVNSYGTITATTIEVNVTIQNSAILGFHDVEVTVGTSSGTGNDLFEVQEGGAYPAPTVTSVVPPTGLQNTTIDVTINGSNFANHPGLSASFGSNITVNNLSFVSGSALSANITIAGDATVGLRDVTVSNPGPQVGTCTNCFTVIFNPVLFTDDFNDGNFIGWVAQGGSWIVNANFRLEGTSAGKATITATAFAGCTDCSVEAEVRSGNGDSATVSLIGWYVDSQNYVELIMNKGLDKWTLKHRVGGAVVSKGKYSDPLDLTANVLYHAKITYDGVNLLVYVHNGVDPVISIPATISQNGTVGFRVKDTSGSIDNVIVNP